MWGKIFHLKLDSYFGFDKRNHTTVILLNLTCFEMLGNIRNVKVAVNSKHFIFMVEVKFQNIANIFKLVMSTKLDTLNAIMKIKVSLVEI